MKIEKILASIRAEKPEATAKPEEKTAAEKPVTAAPAQALAAAVAAAAPEKTAAEKPTASPAQDIAKIASELAAADKVAAEKEAELLGQAWARGALAEFATWQKAAQEMLAAAPAPAVNEAALKQAAEVGYLQAREELEKAAAAEYDRGWNDTVEAIYKTAGEEFLKAAAVTGQLIDAVQA